MIKPIGNYGMDDHKKLEELRKRVADLERENEELRKDLIETTQDEVKFRLLWAEAEERLAALKALSNDEFARAERVDLLKIYEGMVAATPPTATALVEDFKRRCIEVVNHWGVPVGNSAAGEMACEWTMQALRDVRDAIESLPLIEGEQHE